MHVLITKKDGTEAYTFEAEVVRSKKIGNEVAVEIKSDGRNYAFDLSLYDMHVDSFKEMMNELILEQTEQMWGEWLCFQQQKRK